MRSSSRITSSGFGEEHRDDGMLFVGPKLGDCCPGQTVWEDVRRALASTRLLSESNGWTRQFAARRQQCESSESYVAEIDARRRKGGQARPT